MGHVHKEFQYVCKVCGCATGWASKKKGWYHMGPHAPMSNKSTHKVVGVPRLEQEKMLNEAAEGAIEALKRFNKREC